MTDGSLFSWLTFPVLRGYLKYHSFCLPLHLLLKELRQVLFDLRAGNSNLAKSLSEKSNHAMYEDKNPHRCLLFLQN